MSKFVEERTKPYPGKKNTKQWCRGKVNTFHDVDVKFTTLTGYSAKPRILVQFCKNCGKNIDIYYGFSNEKKKPWVIDFLEKKGATKENA